MAKPNRTVAAWRNSNPSFVVVEQHTVRNSFEGLVMCDALRKEGRFDRVVNACYKTGPRNKNQRVFVVRCYAKL